MIFGNNKEIASLRKELASLRSEVCELRNRTTIYDWSGLPTGLIDGTWRRPDPEASAAQVIYLLLKHLGLRLKVVQNSGPTAILEKNNDSQDSR